MPTPRSQSEPIGEILRRQRLQVCRKGLREMAEILKIAPAHLTDIEKGRRTPSEDLMLRISVGYGIPIADLRSGWSRPDAVVSEMATLTPTNAAKIPEFLRTAGDLTTEEWDNFIRQAKKIKSDRRKGGEK